MYLKPLLFSCTLLFLFSACKQGSIQDDNPPAPGFNIEASDHQAVILADEVMEAMGGREAWDHTRYLQWNFFGRRLLTWDKKNGDVRIESLPDSTLYLVNVNTLKGQVKRRGVTESNPDTLKMLLDRAKSIWINDSYWLVMPFKLKDTGVALKYIGKDTTLNGQTGDMVELTFDKVGDTPQNKYHVFIDETSKLVTQWSFFQDAGLKVPGFTTPWGEYQRYGKILLSGDRGERDITDIAVPDSLPPGTFTSLE